MIHSRDINIISHIDNYCDQILTAMSRYGNSFAILKADDVYRYGMGMKLQQITELSQHLTADFTREHGNMPWHSIKCLRIVFVHRYGKLDIGAMWSIMSVDIPELKQFCTKIIALTKRSDDPESYNGPGDCGPRMR
ncbi:MAG: DUF86 domain-containing protein [Deltaproteobacteria bacterium]|jgi:uncharacterized protein with HEPN domain|nr:DUF86 domain-containing protein [Deltaproteobacteria bacterium]